MEGPVELLLLVQVTAVAQIRLLRFQQKLAFFRMVRVVAVGATDAILQVDGTREIPVLLAVLVAVEAARADLLSRGSLEGENLRLISTALDMFLAGTMTSLAAVPLRAFLLVQHGHVVRRILVALEESFDGHVFVAGLASLRAYVEGGIRRARISLVIRLLGGGLFLRLPAKRDHGHKKEHQTDGKSYSALLPVNTHHHPSSTRRDLRPRVQQN